MMKKSIAEVIEMDEMKRERMVKELMRLLQQMDIPESEADYLNEMLERVEVDDDSDVDTDIDITIEELKKELGQWFIEDYKLYYAS